MTAPITVNGVAYTGNPITVDQGEEIFADRSDPKLLNRKLVAATWGVPLDAIGALPWASYQEMLSGALDINGLRPKGEAQATAEN